MSRSLLIWSAGVAALLVFASRQGSEPGVGRPASASEIRARDIDVAPTGAGLPPGHGTAVEGRRIYAAKCASCHGAAGQGSNGYPRLVGGVGTLRSANPVLTVGSYWPYATTVWDYVHRAMPYSSPGSLTPNEVYSVTAYLLYRNHVIAEHDELNDTTLPRVHMPNRGGFIVDSADFTKRPD